MKVTHPCLTLTLVDRSRLVRLVSINIQSQFCYNLVPRPSVWERVWCTSSDSLGLMMWRFWIPSHQSELLHVTSSYDQCALIGGYVYCFLAMAVMLSNRRALDVTKQRECFSWLWYTTSPDQQWHQVQGIAQCTTDSFPCRGWGTELKSEKKFLEYKP